MASPFGPSRLEQAAIDDTWEHDDPLFGNRDGQDDEEQQQLNHGERDKLFAILNLPRDCSMEDVKKSYRRLAAILHPDRHSSTSKSIADAKFAQLQHAFEVLSDPHKRAVYEELGEEGLKTQWEVGVRGRSADELRAEYERMNRESLEKNVESLVRSKGDLTIVSDARVAFLSPAELSRLTGEAEEDLALSAWQRIQAIQAKQFILKHSFTTPVNPATNLVVTSQLAARNGAGAGNLIFKLQHNPSSKLQLEVGTTLLRPRSLTLKSTYSPSPDTFLRLETTPGIRSLSAPPKLTFTLGRRIYPLITGTFTLRTGAWAVGSWGASLLQPYSDSTVSLGLNHANGWGVEATSGVFSKQVSFNWGRNVQGVKVGFGGAVTSVGAIQVGLSVDRRVSENVKLGLGVDVAPTGAIMAKLRFNRLGQRINIPILVSSAFDSRLFLAFTVVPAVGIIATNHFVLGPRQKKRLSGKLKELRKEHADWIKEKRTEALEAQELLREHATKRAAEEEAKNGLVIVQALYGVLEAVEEEGMVTAEEEIRWIDVTIPLQSLLPPSLSQLSIPAGRSKAALLGFYDPALGERKQLLVRYRFKGRMHEARWGDKEAVGVPMRGHLVEDEGEGR